MINFEKDRIANFQELLYKSNTCPSKEGLDIIFELHPLEPILQRL
jgi:hypothetical protein